MALCAYDIVWLLYVYALLQQSGNQACFNSKRFQKLKAETKVWYYIAPIVCAAHLTIIYCSYRPSGRQLDYDMYQFNPLQQSVIITKAEPPIV